MKKLIYLNIGLLSLLLYSCSSDTLYSKTSDLPSTWNYGEKLDFEFTVSDTTKAYDINVIVKHDGSKFKYQNLYVETTTIFPNGESTSSPLSLELSAEDGSWAGDCNGSSCKTKIEISSSKYFNTLGKHKIQIDQFSREKSLEGVRALGLEVLVSKVR